MMQDPVGIPSCFSVVDKVEDSATVTKSGQSIFMSMYKTNIADQCRLITVTWCKNMLLHGLSVSFDGLESEYTCKVELKPWSFWRKQGSKSFVVDGQRLDVFWDLKSAKFQGETEPLSEYYVGVVAGEELVLVLGDMKKDCYRKTGCRPSLVDPVLVLRREHVFGKKKFNTRFKFHEKGGFHDITIECKNKIRKVGSTLKPKTSLMDYTARESTRGHSKNNENGGDDLEMEIRIDGELMIHVNHLQWKFRGNESIIIKKMRIEVYWDVHDWLFSPGLRNALFIIKPSSSTTLPPLLPTVSPCSAGICNSVQGVKPLCSLEFCIFLYAWKVE
nr:hypothetical protein [Tanacetum cinerariifolium]